MNPNKNLWKLCLVVFLSMCLVFSTCSGCFGQDTTKIELCYSFLDCKVKDSTLMEVYNSHCLKLESAYVVENDYGTLVFLDDNKKLFARSIVVWYFKKLKL